MVENGCSQGGCIEIGVGALAGMPCTSLVRSNWLLRNERVQEWPDKQSDCVERVRRAYCATTDDEEHIGEGLDSNSCCRPTHCAGIHAVGVVDETSRGFQKVCD